MARITEERLFRIIGEVYGMIVILGVQRTCNTLVGDEQS